AGSGATELATDLAAHISFLLDDPHTRTIACMVEGIRRPKAFIAAAEKALAAKKPIILVKLGRSAAGQAAAQSHTGAIASDAKVFDAVCRRYGIISAPSLDDMIENCLAFGQGRLPRGPQIGMSCYSGGSKGLALDYAADEGAAMAPLTQETKAKLKTMIDPGLAAENPLDCGPVVGVRAPQFAEICKVVCADPTVDLVTVQGLLPINPGDAHDPAPLRSVFESTSKPVLAFGRIAQNVSEISRKFQAETGVPFIHGLPETIRALHNLVRYAAALQRPVPPPDPPVAACAPDPGAHDALLVEHGLVPPRSALAASPED